MAKEKTEQAASASLTLAERLFVANYRPGSGYTAESLAQKCIEAAEEFHRTHCKQPSDKA